MLLSYNLLPYVVLTPCSEDIIFDHKWQGDDALGLDHPDRTPNKTTAERGIVMK